MTALWAASELVSLAVQSVQIGGVCALALTGVNRLMRGEWAQSLTFASSETAAFVRRPFGAGTMGASHAHDGDGQLTCRTLPTCTCFTSSPFGRT